MGGSLNFFVRCYGERTDDGQWSVICLDFCLAAQDVDFDVARSKLDEQIKSYIKDALTGQDRQHARVLMTRRAPAKYWLKYYAVKAVCIVRNAFGLDGEGRQRRPFREPMPLAPC